MSARDAILARLRAAAPGVATNAAPALDARIDAHYDTRRASAGPAADARVRAMQTALAASHAEVWCATADAWPAQLAARLADAGVRRLLLDAARAESAALARALPETVAPVPFDRPIDAWKTELFDTIDAGFTVARSGIAATGTLVLAPDAGTPRTVSLVPPLHVALVHANTLHADLHAAVHAERWPAGMPTNLVLVSGPSKTSDIQQTLAYGAHGPRRLWVVIVTDSAAPPAAPACEDLPR
ncbi:MULTISPECIES: LutC/YkgG family protein [Burkholderia]|uniref:LUD domain-containing protein n=1 Tax=Burkholderia sola TaxID=2843302 RepID=A0ABV2CIU5_9BURK|nr:MULTISPECIES: LUD domain-containing protein [Burkholderia]KWU22982.1 lactate utilization protein C [Burkholderia cenocepacia]MBP0611063.1 LUD domain-containing protein [Burkholderia sp. CpTa8-5]MBP0718156.1 LUD domain-containing protein [Burkholderia sp. AcTa6-5]OXI74919.1 lactate utilization protein C [Burkholderia sp. AU31280]QRR14585.1 lactate utilization protein C [Burkholderia sp. MS389]